jgi:hypothetical protein
MKSECDPNGIRTRVTAVKGRCPGPLDDRVLKAGQYRIELAARKAIWQRGVASTLQNAGGTPSKLQVALSTEIDN